MAATEVELEDEIDEEAALRRYAGAMRDGEASAASAWGPHPLPRAAVQLII